MLYALLAAALLASPQAAPAAQTPPVSQDPVRLEDVVVDAQRLEDTTEAYVDEVAAPARRRGLARWKDGMCVGVVNLEHDAAQYLADRVSDVARSLGLRAHEPDCHPSVLIVATSDGPAFTEQFVAMRPRLFRVGGATGMDRGSAELRDFIREERPVRWWHVSLPVDSETGLPVVRMPGLRFGIRHGRRHPRRDVGAGICAQYGHLRVPTELPVRRSPEARLHYRRRGSAQRSQHRSSSATMWPWWPWPRSIRTPIPPGSTPSSICLTAPRRRPRVSQAGTGPIWRGFTTLGSETHRINQRAQVQAVASAIASAYRGGSAEPEDLEQP
jgi:hypothetical protein